MENFYREQPQSGFTIFELMIATIVFGALLTILTFTSIRLSNQFYRGVNAAHTQQVARAIADQIGRSIQFSSGGVSQTAPDATNAGVICAADTGFHYVLNQQRSDTVRATAITEGSTPCDIQPKDSLIGDEMLAPGMRLTKLDYSPQGNIFIVTVRVVYGDDDLLCSTINPNNNSCSDSADSTDYTDPNLRCKIGTGSQFCSVAELTVAVFKRL